MSNGLREYNWCCDNGICPVCMNPLETHSCTYQQCNELKNYKTLNEAIADGSYKPESQKLWESLSSYKEVY